MISSMARAFTIFAFACTIAAASISLSSSSSLSSSKPNNRDGKSTTTMVLPLYFNNHSNGHHLDHRRRYIQNVPNARMPLHDDLLLNGYYSAHLWIGTPPQHFALIVDTGSTVTYVPCATCEQCGKHQDPNFEPEASSTYQPVKCNIDCPCDNDREVCTYERQYAEMSSSSGILGEDFVSFGNESGLNPQRATFGCENMETGDLYSQHADGIMGLGRGDLSIVDQLVDKGVINDSFSICYGGMDMGGGAMVLGGISPPADMVFVRSDPLRSSYYNIALREVHVAGKMVPVNSRVFDGKHGTVLDSGTTYAYFPEAAFAAFKAAIFKELHDLKKIPGPDPNYNDICFSGAGSEPSQLSIYFPTIEMVFDDGQKILLSPENYLFRHSKVRGAYCLGVFQNGKDPTTLLGGIIVRNTLVMYDREHKRIGFWKTNCSELWERLNPSTAPPPLITGSNERSSGDTNSTINLVPSPAPSEPPLKEQPGEIEIGLITFHMSSSLKYPELKPHISELSQFIAKELDLNASQVQLMSFTSRANDTLLKWAIYPTGSGDYFINSTAKDILSKLSKNSVHLPDSFGSYKLFEWKIEAPPERTWWQKHYVVIVVASVVMLVSVLLASGAWFFWRRRQSIMSYKPVDSDSAVAEQELTPLQNT